MTTNKPLSAYTRRSRAQYFKDFALDLQNAVTNALPTVVKPYGQVSVLAFHWENDNIGVEPLELDLLEVFRDIYKFHVESFVIPSANSHNSLAQKLLDFSRKWAAKDALRIYIYSGHAEDAGSTATKWRLR
jgi:hypothetical protein